MSCINSVTTEHDIAIQIVNVHHSFLFLSNELKLNTATKKIPA